MQHLGFSTDTEDSDTYSCQDQHEVQGAENGLETQHCNNK